MEANQTTQESSTQTAVKSQSELKPTVKELYTVYPAVFIKFAEYVGYVSKLLSWCDTWVEGKEPEDFKKKTIAIDAQNIFRQMLKDLGAEKIREYYEAFYEVILYEWDDAIYKLEHKTSTV